MTTQTNPTNVTARQQAAAARLGVEADQVRRTRLELRQLREAGLLVDLDIHGISMFSVQTTYAELGIGAEDVRKERLRAGRKDLFPKYSKKLRSLETRARQNLIDHSHPVAAFGGYRWLPWTAYEEFRERHDAIVLELETTKAQLLEEYHDMREVNRAYFARVARRAWRDLVAQHQGETNFVIVTTDKLAFPADDPEAFVEYVVQRALGKVPLESEIRELVRIDYKTSVLYTDSEIAQEQAAEARAHTERELARMDLEDAQERRATKLEEYRRAERDHARQQLSAMGSPLLTALDQLQDKVNQAASELLAGLDKNGGFRGKASSRAAGLFSFWRQLNGGLLQDADLDAKLGELDARMSTYQSSTPDARQTQVGDIAAQLTEIARLTTEETRRARRSASSRASALEL